MASKKTIGIGKSKHWTQSKRVINKTRKLEKYIKRLKPEAQAKVKEHCPICRNRDGRKRDATSK